MQKPKPQKKKSPPSALSLRLPESLRENAARYAEATGLSLNGLVCVALADYLASRGQQQKG